MNYEKIYISFKRESCQLGIPMICRPINFSKISNNPALSVATCITLKFDWQLVMGQKTFAKRRRDWQPKIWSKSDKYFVAELDLFTSSLLFTRAFLYLIIVPCNSATRLISINTHEHDMGCVRYGGIKFCTVISVIRVKRNNRLVGEYSFRCYKTYRF